MGSTPTATFARSLEGVTEVRAGVFVFHDLVMAGLGVCRVEDIAISVLATVIGHQREKGWIITDGGWMAMSRDRGTARQAVDQGYGLVCDEVGPPARRPGRLRRQPGARHRRAGATAARSTSRRFPVGTRLRILPNHACATAAQHDAYHVVRGGPEVVARWPRFSGW